MARFPRIAAAAALTSALVAGAAVPVSADSDRNDRSRRAPAPILLSDRKQSWIAGSSNWINLSWTSKGEIDDLRVKASTTSRNVEVGYSETTGDHAGLMVDAGLEANEIDFTSLYVKTGPDSPKNFNVHLDVQWTVDGRQYRGRTVLQFRGAAFEGDAFAVMTEAGSAVAGGDGSENWLELSYLGLAPATTDFEVSVDGDMPVYLPQDDFTSLHHDDVLLVNETDVARIWFDPDEIEAGEYELDIVVKYSVGGKRAKMTHPIKLTIG